MGVFSSLFRPIISCRLRACGWRRGTPPRRETCARRCPRHRRRCTRARTPNGRRAVRPLSGDEIAAGVLAGSSSSPLERAADVLLGEWRRRASALPVGFLVDGKDVLDRDHQRRDGAVCELWVVGLAAFARPRPLVAAVLALGQVDGEERLRLISPRTTSCRMSSQNRLTNVSSCTSRSACPP